MYVVFIIAIIVFGVTLFLDYALTDRGIKSTKVIVACFLSMLIASTCFFVSVVKVNRAMPEDEQVNTASINYKDMAIESNYETNKKIARYIIELDEEIDFVSVEKNNGVYLVDIYDVNGNELFVLRHWDFYHLIPYLEFDYTSNVE